MQAFVIPPDGGDRYDLRGSEINVKAMPPETGIGGFSVESAPPGFATPEHIHHRDDGVFYVLEGTMRIKCGDLDAIAGAGSMVYLPRGVPHAFRVEGSSPARWFNVQAPHGDFMLSIMGAGADASAEAGALVVLGPPPF
jgi:mannose-6-phosphate isomerase-like protein (cupin superfamily)